MRPATHARQKDRKRSRSRARSMSPIRRRAQETQPRGNSQSREGLARARELKARDASPPRSGASDAKVADKAEECDSEESLSSSYEYSYSEDSKPGAGKAKADSSAHQKPKASAPPARGPKQEVVKESARPKAEKALQERTQEVVKESARPRAGKALQERTDPKTAMAAGAKASRHKGSRPAAVEPAEAAQPKRGAGSVKHDRQKPQVAIPERAADATRPEMASPAQGPQTVEQLRRADHLELVSSIVTAAIRETLAQAP